MDSGRLERIYRDYVACLNARDWDALGRFVDGAVEHNGTSLGLAGYRRMLEQDVAAIPDLHYVVGLLVVQPPHVAARLLFDCTPEGRFLGLAVDGRRIRFSENVFYGFAQDRIARVWSVVDKAAIEAQLAASGHG